MEEHAVYDAAPVPIAERGKRLPDQLHHVSMPYAGTGKKGRLTMTDKLAKGVPGTEKSYEDLMKTSYAARDSAAAIARWIMASLLAVNGGAEAAVLSALDKAPAVARAAGPWFVIGLILAVAGGMCSWMALRSLISHIDEHVDHNKGLVCGEQSTDSDWNGATVFALLVALLFVASLVCFGVGSIAAVRA